VVRPDPVPSGLHVRGRRTKAVPVSRSTDVRAGRPERRAAFPTNVSGSAVGLPAGPDSTNGALDLNTTWGGVIEIRWIYTEFDLTGQTASCPSFRCRRGLGRAANPSRPRQLQRLPRTRVRLCRRFGDNDICAESQDQPCLVILEDQLAGGNRAAAPHERSRRGLRGHPEPRDPPFAGST